MNSGEKKLRRVRVLDEGEVLLSGPAGAMAIAVLPGAHRDAAGVLAMVSARLETAVLAPAAWFPVLTGPGGVCAVPFEGEPMVVFPAVPAPASADWCGRLLAFLLLVLLSPALVLAAIAIRLGDGGPAFFVQERFGRDGRPFRLYKLRTMRPEAEAQQQSLAPAAPAGRPFKVEDDPRATKFGRWLRRHGLDELPQLLNVVRGEMRLVGPRPLPAYEERHYTQPWRRARLDGLPGLTGLWQVSGRNALSFEEMCILDIWYLRNRSLWLDLRILVRTMRVVWRG